MASAGSKHNGRQNVGRVDHIVFAYRNRASQQAAQQRFQAVLGVDDWDDLGEIAYAGLHVLISRKSGLELLCPTRDDSYISQHLATKGEGFYALVYGVADLDAAMAVAKRNGVEPKALPPSPDKTYERFDIAREAILGDIGGLFVVLGEFKPKPGKELDQLDARGRQYVGAIDHVVFQYSSYAAQEAAAQRLSAVLGVDDWADLGELSIAPLRVMISWASGLELICPKAGAKPYSERGDGFATLVFSIADMDKAKVQAMKAGAKVFELPDLSPIAGKWFDVARETQLGEIGAVNLVLGEFAPKGGRRHGT